MSVPPVRDKRGRIAGSRLDSHGLKALVLRLYRSGWSARKIGQELFYSQQAIDKALRRWAEPLRRMGCKGIACLDCGKATEGTIRCKLHTAVEAAKRCKRWREKQ